ncbi:MAG: helix-turn-helix domain-containing protein [Thermoleophilia bacterium]
MFEIGDTLREARIRQDLTLKDAEDALKIRGKYLQALEQDDFEVLPGATFVRAFLRTYAEYLGLDSDVLVAEYVSGHGSGGYDSAKGLHHTAAARPRTRSPRRQPNYVVVAVIALIIIAVLAVAFGNRGDDPAVIDPESVSSTTTTSGPESDAGSASPVAQSELEGILVPDASAATESLEDPNADQLDVLIQVAQNRCWIVVREESASGTTLYSGTLTEGQQLSYSPEGRLWLRIGDPSVVRLFVDGAPLQVPEPYGDFLVTESGLERVE